MRQSTLVLFLLRCILCISSVNAQGAAVFGVSVSLNPSTCAPVNLTWSGGTPPFTPRINVGALKKLLPQVTDRTTAWTPAAAEDITITILDSAGRQSTTDLISVSDDCPTSIQPEPSITQPTPTPSPTESPSAQSTSRDPEALIIGLATGLSILFTLCMLALFLVCRRRQSRNAKRNGWAFIRPGKKTAGWEDVTLPVDLESKGHGDEVPGENEAGKGLADSWIMGDKEPLRIIPPLPAPYQRTRLDSSSTGEAARRTPLFIDGQLVKPLGSSTDSGRRTLRFIPPSAPPPSPSPAYEEPPSPTGSFGTTRSSILLHDRDSGVWAFDGNPFGSPVEEDLDLSHRLSELLLLETQRGPQSGPG